jgi:hypothetical protein
LRQLSPELDVSFGRIIGMGLRSRERLVWIFLVLVAGGAVAGEVLVSTGTMSPRTALLVAFFVLAVPLLTVNRLASRALSRMPSARAEDPRDWDSAAVQWELADDLAAGAVILSVLLVAVAFLRGGPLLVTNVNIDIQIGLVVAYGYLLVRSRLNAGVRIYFQVYQIQMVNANKEIDVWLDVSRGPHAGSVVGKITAIGDRLRVVRDDSYVEDVDWSTIERLAVRSPIGGWKWWPKPDPTENK